jgi:hypothetical protein
MDQEAFIKYLKAKAIREYDDKNLVIGLDKV